LHALAAPSVQLQPSVVLPSQLRSIPSQVSAPGVTSPAQAPQRPASEQVWLPPWQMPRPELMAGPE
jgi:hypothetical protein